MKRKITAIFVLVLVVGVLAVGVNEYSASEELSFWKLIQKLTGMSDSLAASGETDEADDVMSGEWDDFESEPGADSEESGDNASEGSGAEGGGVSDAALGEPEEEGGKAPEEVESASAQNWEASDVEREADEAGNTSIESDPGDGKTPRQSGDMTDAGGGTESAAVSPDSDGSGHQIENFEIIYQMPELPTGCEIVAMTMVLNYYGFDVDKTVMASEYLPTKDAVFYYGSDGLKYGPDLNKYFVGDPFSNGGYICGTEAILTATNSYLQDAGSSLAAVDLTGSTPEELYRLVSQDIPVVVWVTIGMVERYSTAGWYTEEGEYVEWSSNDHGAVLIGYTEDTVTIADPISGLVEYSREDFESVFESRGNQCVILRG